MDRWDKAVAKISVHIPFGNLMAAANSIGFLEAIGTRLDEMLERIRDLEKESEMSDS